MGTWEAGATETLATGFLPQVLPLHPDFDNLDQNDLLDNWDNCSETSVSLDLSFLLEVTLAHHFQGHSAAQEATLTLFGPSPVLPSTVSANYTNMPVCYANERFLK